MNFERSFLQRMMRKFLQLLNTIPLEGTTTTNSMTSNVLSPHDFGSFR